MRLIVLGATGFLGSTLYGLALERPNVMVYGTSRFPSNNPTIFQVNVTDSAALEMVIKKTNPDIVVWSLIGGENEEVLIKLGLTNVLSVVQRETKLIYLSTDAVFVEGKGNYSENSRTGFLPEEASLSSYVNSKLSGEHMILNSQHANHVILRTGPLYGEDSNQNIEKRTLQIIDKIKRNQPTTAASNLYKTFVHVEDLAEAILEMSLSDFNGILHAGPIGKESYYSFYKKRLNQLSINNRFVHTSLVDHKETPYLPLDTSLNTQKAKKLLSTQFREVY